jgi:hypothetical protein
VALILVMKQYDERFTPQFVSGQWVAYQSVQKEIDGWPNRAS